MDYIEKIIQEIIGKANLRQATERELRRELLSHFLEQKHDFELQGLSSEKIPTAIRTSFGDTTFISKQLAMVEKSKILKDKIITSILVSFITSTVLSMVVMSYSCLTFECGFENLIGGLFGGIVTWILFVPVVFMNTFSLWFLVFQTILVFLVYGILHFFKTQFPELKTRIKTIAVIFSLAVILQCLSIFVSYQKISYPQKMNNETVYSLPEAKAGFPLSTFEFPFPPMGNDHVPSSMWLNFYINYGIWLLVAIILYPFIPKRFKNQSSAVLVLSVVAITTFFFSLGWIIWQFD